MIPIKYRLRSIFMGIWNKKHWKHWWETFCYRIIERTGPVRHAFRK